MTFIHPGIAIAAGGLALAPLLIHLLSRQGHRREPWAAMQFLVSAERRSRRRLRIEQWVLILLRAFVLIVAGLTLARPFSAGSSIFSILGEARRDCVIVVDDSLSMRARHPDEATAFDQARKLARRLIAEADAMDGFAIIGGARPARALVDQPTRDRQLLDRLLQEWVCSPGLDDLHVAIRLASDALGRSSAPAGGRVCYVLTDLTAAAFATDLRDSADEISKGHPNIDKLIFIDVGATNRDNLAVTDLRLLSQIVGVGVPARFAVDLTNAGSTARDSTGIEIAVNGSVAAMLDGAPLAAGETAHREFELAFDRAGSHRVRALFKSPGLDALPDDNVRYLAVDVLSSLNVLAVQDDANGAEGAESLFFYAASVASRERQRRGTDIQLRTISAARLSTEPLEDHDLVVLGDVARPLPETARRLERFVEAGGGLLVFLGKQADAGAYNRLRSEGDLDLLPFRLADVRRFDDAASLPGFEIADPRHPAMADFAGNVAGGLLRATVRACRRIEPRDQDTAIHTILRLTTGEAIAVSHTLGRGTVTFWLTSPDMSWTNLPAKPDFVPLMLNLTVHAVAKGRSGRNILAGEMLLMPYPSRFARSLANISTPDGPILRSELHSEDTGAWLKLGGLDVAGFYGVSVDEDRRDFAVNYDSGDRNLARADEAVIRHRYGSDALILSNAEEAVARESTVRTREFAQVLMVCLLALVAGETLVSAWFGGRR